MVVNRRCSFTKHHSSMWDTNGSALQTLHKASSKAREENYFQGGLSHEWVDYYEGKIQSDRSCLNEWHAMDDLESRRPPSPDSVRTKPHERDETEMVIRSTLKEIMMSVDLDEVTSKYIRGRLEEELDMDLGEYKSFIDQEMLTILGQMDAPTEIFDHVYLGSEWNASNYEELKKNGVRHILNVTREIDNFFPGTFDYLNVRVYDDEKTDLLKFWDNTYKYITKAKEEGSKVLVHCKMGVSRSASVVIAYAMKAYNWDFKTAMQHVKEKRSCIKPNTNFVAQLETYQGILDAMKNKEKLQRSKSETNLSTNGERIEKTLPGSRPTPLIQALQQCSDVEMRLSGEELRNTGARPKSWSPDPIQTTEVTNNSVTSHRSLDSLNKDGVSEENLQKLKCEKSIKNVLLPCDNGESYSVSPNQIRHIPSENQDPTSSIGEITTSAVVSASVKQMVNEFESQKSVECRKKLVLNVTKTNETNTSKCPSPDVCDANSSSSELQQQLPPHLDKNETWDPGETSQNNNDNTNLSLLKSTTDNCCDDKSSVSANGDEQTMWTSSTVLQTQTSECSGTLMFANTSKVPETVIMRDNENDIAIRTGNTPLRKGSDPFSNQLDKVFDREERKQQRVSVIPTFPVKFPEETEDAVAHRECPSRQSSWSSYDSAVVLGYQGESRGLPSRHSSWGSGDTRTLPSRNSSWGSYDMRPTGKNCPTNNTSDKDDKNLTSSGSDIFRSSSSGMFPYDKEDIPWHPGTVKRTKQKIEENNKKSEDKQREGSDVFFIDDGLTSSDISLADSHIKSNSSETLGTESAIENESGIVEAVNTCLIQCKAENDLRNANQSVLSPSATSPKLDIANSKRNLFSSGSSRLSVSAPESSAMEMVAPKECSLSRSTSNVSSASYESKSSVVNTAQCSSVKKHKIYLESLSSKDSKSQKKDDMALDNAPNNPSKSGIVRSLKKEFESKTTLNVDDLKSNNTSSAPTSPVSIHVEIDQLDNEGSDPGGEDLSLKKLIGKFELTSRENSQVNLRTKHQNKQQHGKSGGRYSCIEVSADKSLHNPIISCYGDKSRTTGEFKRPPIAPVVRNPTPNVVMATVIAKAAKKQQQFGKSHPLARLHIKPRHSNPVYNTM
ncbi:protein phosphatase Slingshot-like isoform X2 [Agrilus planipennis]|uniref:protein-serine/threonine phosphatase n=1 Tax=Agrilus planipennis TaxID=224129 RepID=A0A1W4XJR8_AGRPL|nr:protein phosphatase Slingshot-like isoform X2 [Agrilus planipennis]